MRVARFGRLAGIVLIAGLFISARPAAQSADIDSLISKGNELASPQVRRSDLAIPYLKQALALSEHREDPGRAALAAARLGQAYRSMHQVQNALTVLQRGAVSARVALRPDLEGLCLRTIGNIHTEGGDYEAAGEYFRQSIAIADRYGDRALKVASLNALSASSRLQGRLGDAIEYARAGLQLLDAQIAAGEHVDSQPLFALPFNVGKALADSGDYAAALEYFERAFTSAQEHGLIAGVWHALFDTAEWYQGQGDFDRAAAYYRRALEQSRKAESRDMEAHTIRGLGTIAEARGQFSDAIAEYTRALDVYRTAGLGAWVPSTTIALARVQRKAGYVEDANDLLARALERARAQGRPLDLVRALLEAGAAAAGSDSVLAERRYDEARRIAVENGLRPMEIVADAGLARVVHERGEAERALGLYLRAEDTIRRLQARIPNLEQRTTFREAVHATFAGELDLLMKLSREHRGSDYERLAFLALERERAQDLTGALVDGRVDAPRTIATSDRQAAIGRRLAEVQTELMSEDISADRRRTLRGEQDDREREWEAVAQRPMTSASIRIGGSAPAADALDEVRRTLADDEAFIEYSARHAFVVTRSGLRAAELPVVEGLPARIDFFVRLLSGDGPDQAPVSGRILSSALIAPVLALVPSNTSRLVVSATGPLAGVPFAALPDPGAHGDVPLLVRYSIAYASSGGALARTRGMPPTAASRALLAVANPPSITSRPQLVTASLTRSGSLGALPYSEQEIGQVAARVAGRSRVLAGPMATEYEIKRLPWSEYSVLHFATHAVLDPVSPMRSAIVLGAGKGEDGLLQAREIFQLSLDADLVVLSACRTGAGRASAAEGIQSLAHAFMYAGARSVLGTLWDVDDRSTADVMDRFYQQAALGMPVVDALRRAQMDVMGRNPYRTAPLWAGFVLSGNGAVKVQILRPTQRLSTWAAVGATIAAGVLMTLAMHRRRRRRVFSAV